MTRKDQLNMVTDAHVPEVTVVTSVYNSARHLAESADSILQQQLVSLEWIIVNDGSTDDSPRLLDELARRDARVRVIHQTNQGLTRALVTGCAAARGEFLARHDADDISFPDRLDKQTAYLREHPEVAIVSCFTRLVGPEMETLAEIAPTLDARQATQRLQSRDVAQLIGPTHHGSVLFRRADYVKVGGYQPSFYFAQDLDLWLRLSEVGYLSFLPEVLYIARFDEGCLSSQNRPEQIATSQLIMAAATARRHGEDESPFLKQAESIRPAPRTAGNRRTLAATNYWMGRMLQARRDSRARRYFGKALEHDPFLWRARIALFLSWFGSYHVSDS